ncbi:DNA-binding transcriptional regulator, XRE-family HTH domain [Thermomonospora echinospora]|uniref:DNA-binding transcriptional regulator, XRE-family HTH domain n=1 Tax=Thermomonospora echinospora TaxID=1992 RepID=A0A1H6AX10_9ACTN|nr:helix-turn-helix transcriptional regulator [Thermomonospora echinospora]SEG52790.1 DNA-binding transcriptional regulator, XRE-family HTH domain [Thermomonospora echinospora]
MPSPFVRRLRLAAELRALREERGMTADELSRLLYQSRPKVSKLENGHLRPDLALVMKILDLLDVTGDKWHEVVTIARDAAERGWWDRYGAAMGDRQRMYADIESGAKSIRGYNQFGIPGILQTPEFTMALVELDKADGPLDYSPERMIKARLQRRKAAFGPEGLTYELILDEFVMRRLAVAPEVMSAQLLHLVETASYEPRLTVHVLPMDARIEGGFLARSTFAIYTFPDPNDPTMAIADTVNTDVVHTATTEVARYIELYQRLRDASLSAVSSLTFLEEAANRLAKMAGS